jgi:hypothetical protein
MCMAGSRGGEPDRVRIDPTRRLLGLVCIPCRTLAKEVGKDEKGQKASERETCRPSRTDQSLAEMMERGRCARVKKLDF